MTQPNQLFGHDFSSVLSQLQLAADAASSAVSKLLATAPRPHDAAGFTHVCTGAHAALSAALEFLKDPNETAIAIDGALASLQQRVQELTSGMPGEELAMPKGRRLKKFPGWKMLTALGQPGVSKACLIAGGLLLMHAWRTGRRIPRAQALSITAEAQRCELSDEGLRLLLESPVDAKDTSYPWLTQLQRNWPKLLNLFTVDGGNHPPKPPSFTHRARGQLIAAAEHASVVPRSLPAGREVERCGRLARGESAAAAECEVETAQARPHRIGWARLLKRVFDIDMQHCPNCGGGELKIIAAILERPVIEKILTHLGLDPQPPPRGRAREAAHD
jgi:hypothetical protein